MSILESFYTRGDKRLNEFIYELYKNGAYLESWDENLDYALYEKIADELNINISKLASKEFKKDDILPWDKISYGVEKSWLWMQYEKAKETMEIYSPIAHRLGISRIKWELEDLALWYLDPEEYYELVDGIAIKRREREAFIEETKEANAIALMRRDARLHQMEVSNGVKHM